MITLLLLLACSGEPASTSAPSAPPAPATSVAAVRTVDVATLKADLDRHAVPILIDVRTPEEFAGGHVPGAKNVPIDTLDPRAADLGTGDVYVICQSGGRSARASATLAAAGRASVNVAGGTAAWKGAGYPVEGAP